MLMREEYYKAWKEWKERQKKAPKPKGGMIKMFETISNVEFVMVLGLMIASCVGGYWFAQGERKFKNKQFDQSPKEESEE